MTAPAITLSRAMLVDPSHNRSFAIPAVALSMFVFAYSADFGPPAILTFYACWLPLLLVEPRILLRDARRVLPLLVLPMAAVFSTLWSDQPAITLRAAIQYGSTIFCGLIAARVVSVPTLAIGGLTGTLLILLYSFADGSYAYDAMDGTYAFIGAFRSKNQVGYFASLAILFALGPLLLFRERIGWRLVALLVATLATLALARSQSVTSILTTGVALVAVLSGRVLITLPPGARRVVIFVLLIVGCAGVAGAYQFGVFDQVLQIFGKDATLTGRTFLWQRAIEIGSEDLWFGLGYSAFWSHGRPEAEAIWEMFYISSRAGFHFHNTYLEALVGLGLFGVLLTGWLTIWLIVLSLRVLLNRFWTSSAVLCVAISLLFVLRALVEIDFYNPYTAGAFLMPYLILLMADQRQAEVAALLAAPSNRQVTEGRSAN